MRMMLLAVLTLPLLACKPASPPPPAATEASHFETSTSVKDLMGWVIDPSAGILWGATGSEVTAEGMRDFFPKTDEEWNRLRTHAVIVAESGNLLMLEGRARDRQQWLELSRAMTDKAHLALAAIDAKDKDALFESGGELYQACSDCHALYMVKPDAEAAN